METGCRLAGHYAIDKVVILLVVIHARCESAKVMPCYLLPGSEGKVFVLKNILKIHD